MKTKDQIIEQIMALMNKSVEAGCTISEAEASAAKVSDLVARYHIEQGELIPKEDVYTQDTVLFKCGGHQNWSRLLASVVASITGTFFAYRSKEAVFYGRGSDVKLAVYYFTQLQERSIVMARNEAHKQYAAGDADAKNHAWFRSYLVGFSKGLRDKTDAQRRQTAASVDKEKNSTTALMVINKREEDAEAYAKSISHMGKGTGIRYSRGGDAYGYVAGLNTDLHAGVTSGQGRKRLS